MRRSEVWWAELSPKSRPVIILTRDTLIPLRDFLVIAPVTSRVRHLQSEVALGVDDGLSKACVVNTSTLETIPKNRLLRRLAALNPSKREAVDKALGYALGLD